MPEQSHASQSASIPQVQLSRGSTWHKWDLHIHSPASGLNNQFPRLSDGSPDWEAYVQALEQLEDIPALGITDYFSIEGYRKLLEYKSAGRLANIQLLLPNIEFRLDNIIGTPKGPKRINYHVIFSDQVSPDEIDQHFLQELKFKYEAEPQRQDLSFTIRRVNLELLGTKLKAEHATFNDHRSAYEIGCMTATVDPGQIKDVLHNKEGIFKGKYLIVLAEEHLGLLDWNGQDHLTRKVLLQGTDSVFSSNPKTITWTRGEGDLASQRFVSEFKSLKPCIHGSDAHDLKFVGHPCGKRGEAAHDCFAATPDCDLRFCWIKSRISFEGLKQILYEPVDRVFIGTEPARLKNDYQVIESISISDCDSWFAPQEIPLNSELVATIGARGSGKSALAEMIAFAGGASSFHPDADLDDMFLYKASKKSPANPVPITGAKLVLKWKDGHADEAIVTPNLLHGKDVEKVKYLPQKFVELLCAPDNTKQLESEIERVIFQRIQKTEKQDCSDFDELRKTATESIEVKREKLNRVIQELNQAIAESAIRMAQRPIKEADLKRKKEELSNLNKKTPRVPLENKEEIKKLDELTKKKESIEAQIISLTEKLNTLNTIEARYQVLTQDIESFNIGILPLLATAGLEEKIEVLKVDMPQAVAETISEHRTGLQKQIEVLRVGTEENNATMSTLNGLLAQIETIRKNSQLTAAKQKEYSKFQNDRQILETAITSLEKEIKEITDVESTRWKKNSEERLERYLDCVQLLLEEQEILEKLYEPLHTALLSSNDTAKKLTFYSRISFDRMRHAARGMSLLDKRKSVYRDEDDLEARLGIYEEQLRGVNFERESTRKALIELRDSFLRSGDHKIRIEDQLRKDNTMSDFSNWFYSTDNFSVSYAIRFDGKELGLLSPGEKGIVLLLMYLEAEQEDNRPLIIDQPDDNLDNLSVYPSLIDYFRARKKTRQIIIITHNPNLVVNTDAEQILIAGFNGSQVPKITYRSGALEDSASLGESSGIRESVCDILEGGTIAFQKREQKYSFE